MKKPVVLTKSKQYAFVQSVLPEAVCVARVEDIPDTDCLLSYNTGVIVPPLKLTVIDMAINFHGAPPSYPGRDPHHWAAYDQAEIYGATAHYMAPKVGSGFIAGVMLTAISGRSTPKQYRARGEACLQALFATMAKGLYETGAMPIGVQWSGTKRSRNDTIAMCDMRGADSAEVTKRRAAFYGFEGYFRLPGENYRPAEIR